MFLYIPLWIIEENERRRREEDRDRPMLEIPSPPPFMPEWDSYPEKDLERETQRGEYSIPLW